MGVGRLTSAFRREPLIGPSVGDVHIYQSFVMLKATCTSVTVYEGQTCKDNHHVTNKDTRSQDTYIFAFDSILMAL